MRLSSSSSACARSRCFCASSSSCKASASRSSRSASLIAFSCFRRSDSAAFLSDSNCSQTAFDTPGSRPSARVSAISGAASGRASRVATVVRIGAIGVGNATGKSDRRGVSAATAFLRRRLSRWACMSFSAVLELRQSLSPMDSMRAAPYASFARDFMSRALPHDENCVILPIRTNISWSASPESSTFSLPKVFRKTSRQCSG
ncbi:unnamed protein product, partial [Mycena citricolor]